MGRRLDTWPYGRTWVFQGTIAEDATAGTHVCTLTLTPGQGNEMLMLYGRITVGNTATAQVVSVTATDGTNELGAWIDTFSGTTANSRYNFPDVVSPASAAFLGPTGVGNLISGTMQLVLKVSTAAVSVTQTFSVVCRIKGGVPTATLLDTIGTSTNTVNTNRTF